MEKKIKTVANITKADVVGVLKMAEDIKLGIEPETYKLSDANQAIKDLKKNGRLSKSKILII